jgi:superfamily II DNA helicase RecQ
LKLKVFTFGFSESSHGFDDVPLQEFIAEREVIEFSEHFFIHEKTPYLTIIISYREISHDEKGKVSRKHDPRSELDDKERNAYDALRVWRSARAKQEGIPPYMIVNNMQIAKMIKLKAMTKSDLAGIRGIGEAKTSAYGEDILRILGEHLGVDSPISQEQGEEAEA